MHDRPILIVEDDAATLEFLLMLVTVSGYMAQGAPSGHEAEAAIAATTVRAILLDRRLPDVDGLSLCRELRDSIGDDVPIIMMTADAEYGLAARVTEAGADRLLHKPFMPQQLLDTLQSVLA